MARSLRPDRSSCRPSCRSSSVKPLLRSSAGKGSRSLWPSSRPGAKRENSPGRTSHPADARFSTRGPGARHRPRVGSLASARVDVGFLGRGSAASWTTGFRNDVPSRARLCSTRARTELVDSLPVRCGARRRPDRSRGSTGSYRRRRVVGWNRSARPLPRWRSTAGSGRFRC
jgi:hypothetical protein